MLRTFQTPLVYKMHIRGEPTSHMIIGWYARQSNDRCLPHCLLPDRYMYMRLIDLRSAYLGAMVGRLVNFVGKF